MGIVNVTPDSFSDGGRYLDAAAAVAHGRRLVKEGADIIDVGGESTRPGAAPVSEEDELRRVLPVIEALAPDVRVSVDTTKPAVARAAVRAGATLLNDVSASLHDVAAEAGVGWVAMHRKGTPTTMQLAPRYDDVVAEVHDFLVERADAADAAGVSEVWIDPGIGFGKTAAHNLSLLRHLDRLVATGRPVLVGTSRKAFLGTLLARSDGRTGARRATSAATDGTATDATATTPTAAEVGGGPRADTVAPDDRLEGSLATATWALAAGAAMVRVHDVLATVQATRVVAG
jgi:dihydropteroate synthase